MAVVNKSVNVGKVSNDVMMKLADMVMVMKKAASDGVNLNDLPVAINACVVDLLPAIQELSLIPAEYDETEEAVENAFALGFVQLKKAVLS